MTDTIDQAVRTVFRGLRTENRNNGKKIGARGIEQVVNDCYNGSGSVSSSRFCVRKIGKNGKRSQGQGFEAVASSIPVVPLAR